MYGKCWCGTAAVCVCVIVTVLYSVFNMFICCPALTGIYLTEKKYNFEYFGNSVYFVNERAK